MANAHQILADKGGHVVSVSPGATVLHAAELMNEHHIGSVLVLDKRRLVGIFTERDVMRRVVVAERDPATTRVREVMTRSVACATPATTRDELRDVMREKRIRHVPVVEGEQVIGLISIGDLNRAESKVHVETIHYLEQYVSML